MESVLQDIRYAVRALRKSPGLAFLAVICMGLGIASVTTMFSTAEAFTFRPLPQVRDAGRVLHVWQSPADAPQRYDGMFPATFRDARELPEFSDLAAERGWNANITGSDLPERVIAAQVTANFVHAFGQAPLLGRDFTRADEDAGSGRIAILSYGLWQRRFGGDRGILGQVVRLNGEGYTVVGVLPEAFVFPPGTQLLVPLALTPEQWASRTGPGMFVLGRLAPKISASRAQAALAALGARLAVAYPQANPGWVIRAESAEHYFGEGPAPFMAVLLAAGVFVLLIACANVANLLLARATGRRRELAMRIALGAPRSRIVRQQLTESVLIGLAGGVLGVIGAYWGNDALATSVPVEVRQFIPGFGQIGMDWRALTVAVGAGLLSGVLFGLAPAFAAARVDVQSSLKEGARGEVGGAHTGRLRSSLVVAEVALALLLLLGAAQTMDTFRRLALTDPGFRAPGVLTLSVTLPAADYPADSTVVQFWENLRERVAGLPGVQAVAATTVLPLSWDESAAGIEVEGQPLRNRENAPIVGWRRVSPGYLETMAIPLVRGRSISPADRMGTTPVAVISEAMASLFWSGSDAVGKRFRVDTATWIQVVGVVRDVRANPLIGSARRAVVYAPSLQRAQRTMSLVVRAAGDPTALAGPIQRAINALDSRLAAGDVSPMPRVIETTLSPQSATAQTLFATALVALVMACVGIYGVMAYGVTQRTQEIGVRVALGATPGGVLRLVLGGALKLAGIGVAIGLVGAFAMGRALQAILVDTKATDPVILASLSLLLAAVTVGASLAPARRATKVDPMEALRSE